MSDTSPALSLPLIQPAQAQKHVTHNEALQILDAVVQLVVIATDQTTPPTASEPADRYIVAAPATGAWSGHDGEIAVYTDGTWRFIVPQPGWRAEVLAPKATVIFDADAGWQPPAMATRETTPQLGINTVADPTNRLSLSAPATLLNHEGAGHRLKLNKAAPANTASLLFQSGFSGRAEMGLAGSDDFAVKVSDDGTTWREALRAEASTGRITIPGGIESLQFIVEIGGVVTLTPPSPAGFVFLSSVSSNFPQGNASMVMCYDVGPSPQLATVWAGSSVTNLGDLLPTGSSAPDGKVGVAVQADGTLHVENRHSTGNDLQYCVTWINGFRPLG